MVKITLGLCEIVLSSEQTHLGVVDGGMHDPKKRRAFFQGL
ncbi:MAG: hypothetical protein O7B35_14280 [Deltaproteobacteria bacterium]|nr:hypothetical protein [Deltaproteobacteria bacterium]